jgi:hypothetical protein
MFSHPWFLSELIIFYDKGGYILWFWSYPEKVIIFIVLGKQEVILPQNLIVEKGGELLNLDVPDKSIKVQLPVLRNGFIMEICLTKEVLIPSRCFCESFDKICWV